VGEVKGGMPRIFDCGSDCSIAPPKSVPMCLKRFLYQVSDGILVTVFLLQEETLQYGRDVLSVVTN